MKKIFIILLVYFSFAVNIPAQTPADTSLGLDEKIFHLINSSRTPLLDKVVSVTDKSILFASVLTPPALFTISRINKHYYDENSAVLLGTSEVLSYGITYALKRIFNRTRPFGHIPDVK
ncbi:MAG TPA: hypothetical protein PK447_01710, partial [Ignavibacteria bacterium]|nr:hypothetical protein [Ignavibacteria bacterium]